MKKKIAVLFVFFVAFNVPTWADDAAIVKSNAESIYSKRFNAKNHDVKIEEIRSFLGDHLYALLDKAYNHPAPDTNGLESDPFENAQDIWESYAVQNPIVSGNQASVTVLLSGMDGNKNEKTEVYLQFAKQSDGRWVIDDICYPGGGFNLVKSLSEDDSSPASSNVETATVNAKSGVSLRKTAGKSGEKIVTLPFGSKVTVISKDGPEDVIEGKKEKWFCVSCQGMQGWAFGGFLDVALPPQQPGPMAVQPVTPPAPPVVAQTPEPQPPAKKIIIVDPNAAVVAAGKNSAPIQPPPSEPSAPAPKDGDQIIAKVKASHPSPLDRTPYTLEYTLESFCEGNSWRYFSSKSGQDIVEYSGSAKQEFLKPGAELSFCIQYQCDPKLETPKPVYFELNGEKQPPEACAQILMMAMGVAMQRKAREGIPDKVE